MTKHSHSQFDNAEPSAPGLGRRVIEYFGWKDAPPEEKPLRLKKLEAIYDFLDSAQLDPTPEAYRLAWEYLYGANQKLCMEIDALMEDRGTVPLGSVYELTAQHLNIFDFSELTKLINSGTQVLRQGHKVIADSRGDNRNYSKALKQEMEQIDQPAGSDNHLTRLFSLTNAMIKKSQDAERQLKEAESNVVKMRKKLDDATQKAETDQLTGLPNRWAFEDVLKEAVAQSKKNFEPLTVAFIDIDHFKVINDSYGHDVGDRVLKRVAGILNSMSDERCHLARHGGEEFVTLFSDKTPQQVFDIVDKTRDELASQNFTIRETEEQIGTVSFSAGIATLGSDGDPRAMLRRADAALYYAKENGRNQVVIDKS
ncbi:MAG: GGDEF domain-containing protein [Pseudomonadota bacterium]